MIGGDLHANAVGENAVVRLDDDGRAQRVWWPKCIETESGPVFGRNHLQLNSIAAGNDLADSYFSASSRQVTRVGGRAILASRWTGEGSSSRARPASRSPPV